MGVRLTYGFGAIAYGIKDNGFAYFLLLFYGTVVGLEPALVGTALLMLVGFGQITGLVIIPAVIILSREILVSGLREYLAGQAVSLPVSTLAKWKTTLQMFALPVLIVGDAAHPFIPVEIPIRLIGETGLWIAAAITLITGYDYLRSGLRHMDTPMHAPTDGPADIRDPAESGPAKNRPPKARPAESGPR